MKRRREQGSALLIVFVFAAMIAIALYMEMPVAVFEAKRQKEQLLIDRGEEYAHAVRLFVRKTGHYPTSIDQLEDTNRMRFLRHRFKDPFTGKDDWRLLHAGPGGILIDSKVKSNNPLGTPGAAQGNSGFASNSGFGSSSGSLFGANSGFATNSGFGSNTRSGNAGSSSTSGFDTSGSFAASSNSAPEVVVPQVPQRPPEVPANTAPGGGAAIANPADQDPTKSLLASQTASGQGTGALPDAGGQLGANATAVGQPNATSGPAQAAAGVNPGVAAVPQRQAFGNLGTTRMGALQSGGLAGVASKAGGKTIKVINDQTDYSLWEFYYDPTKDRTQGTPGAGPGGMQPQNGAAPRNGAGGFGSSSGITTSFSSGTTTTAPQNPAPQNPTPQNSEDQGLAPPTSSDVGPQPQTPESDQQ